MDSLNDDFDLIGDNSGWADFTPPAKRRRFTEPASEPQLLSAPTPWRTQSDPNQLGSYNNFKLSPISLKRRRESPPFADASCDVERRILASDDAFPNLATAIPEDKDHPQSRLGTVNEGRMHQHFCEHEQSVEASKSELVCFGVVWRAGQLMSGDTTNTNVGERLTRLNWRQPADYPTDHLKMDWSSDGIAV